MMSEELTPVKGLIKLVTVESGWNLGEDGQFTVASPGNPGFRESVQYALDRECVPTTLDDGAALIDRLGKKDWASLFNLHAGTLRFQTYENGRSKIRVLQPKDREFWERFVQQIPKNVRYVDLNMKEGFGKELLDMSNSKMSFEVPDQDLVLPFEDAQYENDSTVKIIFPKNSGRLVSAIQREYLERTHGVVWFSRLELDEDVARVGPFGLVGRAVVAGGGYYGGRARGKLPVGAQKIESLR